MMIDFLKEYIPQLLECVSNVELTADQIEKIAMAIDADEHFWEEIDTRILQESEKI